MGISVSAMMVTDEQIRQFTEQPGSSDAVSNKLIPAGNQNACCYLFGYWSSICDVLTARQPTDAWPYDVLADGEVRFKQVDDPTWALSSEAVKIIAADMEELTEPEIQTICKPWGKSWIAEIKRAKKAGATAYRNSDPEKMWQREISDLASYLFRFRDFATRAAAEGKGLMFCQYEDW